MAEDKNMAPKPNMKHFMKPVKYKFIGSGTGKLNRGFTVVVFP